jgi:hypothetical protein
MPAAALVHTNECPCLHTHYPACMEFLNGFTEFGYNVTCATSLHDCKDKDILMLSSHIVNIQFLHRLNEINPDAVYILWYYHAVIDQIPFKKYIITGEYFHYTPRMDSHIQFDTINKSIRNYVPLMLRADDSPASIGVYTKTYELDGCFMGTAYKPDWVAELPNIVYHDISHGFLSYDERRTIHLKSKIAFGFSSDSNILNYHPTQRIFEGLAYGCVVLSDNEAARDLTGGIVEYVSSKEEFLSKYNYYLSHPEECKKKELEGYAWAKQYGTNRHSARLFLDKIQELGF